MTNINNNNKNCMDNNNNAKKIADKLKIVL